MRTRHKTFTEEQKWQIYDRDNGICAVDDCLHPIEQFDHAFPKSLNMACINDIWNGNGICYRHHHNITHRLEIVDMEIRLYLMKLALDRAKKCLPKYVLEQYNKEYHQRKVRLKYKINESSN